MTTAQHFARPLADLSKPGTGIHAQYVMPPVCAVCGKPIVRQGKGGGAWRHA